MQQEEEQHFIDELKQFVTENFPGRKYRSTGFRAAGGTVLFHRTKSVDCATDLQFYSWFWVIGYNFDR